VTEPHWLKLELPKPMLRQMSRKTYYQVQSYLRLARRKIEEELQCNK